MIQRPSERFIKHGVIYPPERFHQMKHNPVNDIDGRNVNYETTPPSSYYTPSEIELMKRQIKQAECPICLQPINDHRCRVCGNGHKFHSKCDERQNRELSECPVCRDNNIEMCNGNYNDFYSGGKYSRKLKIKKRSKSKKHVKTKRSKRKSRKSRKSRKN